MKVADPPVKTPTTPVIRQTRITHRIEIVTPEIAARWLERNETNRKLDQSTVDRYARDMRAGRWHLTGEPIQFGISGRLLNGQHRLWACVESDVAFETMVIRGLVNEDEIVDVIDTGKKRTLGNAFQIHGEKDAMLLAAIVNTCWRYEDDRCKGPYPTHEEGLAYLNAHPNIREATKIARIVYSRVKAQASAVGAAYYLNSLVDGEASEEFWMRAADGEGLAAGDAILAYRRWVIQAVSRRDKPIPNIWLAYNLKAMSQWRAGKNVRVLAVKPDEGMPDTWDARS